jgi:predicted amidophosphoribosyltransferase
MEFIKSIKTLGRHVADLVFPVLCVVCGEEGLFLCSSCQIKLPRLERQLCIVCKKPAAYGKTHPDCVSRNTVDGTISALSYKHPDTKKLVGTFKYQFIYDLAPPLSAMIVDTIKNQELGDYFSDFTIIPVPLHKRRFINEIAKLLKKNGAPEVWAATIAHG